MDPVILRSIERIVAVLIGGLSIYLGFRLFLAIPERIESGGKIVLPGGIAIYLTRVGPGAFFALFGAIVVASSFHSPISYKEGPDQSAAYNSASRTIVPTENIPSKEMATHPSRSYTGFGDASTGEDLQLTRMQAASDIKFLNTAVKQFLRKDLTQAQQTDLEVLIPRLKLALVKSVWDPSWGEFAKLNAWVDGGATGPAPNETAARLYVAGEVY